MAGAIFANNVTIKISSAVNSTATIAASTTTMYTVPANSYAIVTVMWLPSGNGDCTLSNTGSSTTTMSTKVATLTGVISRIGDPQMYLGPGQALKMICTNGGDYYVTGVCFVNSP